MAVRTLLPLLVAAASTAIAVQGAEPATTPVPAGAALAAAPPPFADKATDGPPAAIPGQSAGPANEVVLEIYYGPMCSNCQAYLSMMVPELLSANLPGDRVKLTVLPWVLDRGEVPPPRECVMPIVPCYFLPAPLCALQAVDMPGPIDSPEMVSAVAFSLCDLGYANAGSQLDHDNNTIGDCAKSNSVDATRLNACMAANTREPSFVTLVKAANERLSKLPDLMAPFIFINGQILVCQDPQHCTGIQLPDRVEPLTTPGTLLQVLCSQIPGELPAACQAALAPQVMMNSQALPPLLDMARQATTGTTLLACALAASASLLGVAVWRGRVPALGEAAAQLLRPRDLERAWRPPCHEIDGNVVEAAYAE